MTKNRRYELMYHCLQYREWQKELTGEIAPERRAGLIEKKTQVEDCCKLAGGAIAPYLLKAVTEPGVTYTSLRSMGMPCGKNYFYKRRRIFYSLLDGLRR